MTRRLLAARAPTVAIVKPKIMMHSESDLTGVSVVEQ